MLESMGVKPEDLPQPKVKRKNSQKASNKLNKTIIRILTMRGFWAFRCNSGLARAYHGPGIIQLAPKGTPDIMGHCLTCGKAVGIEGKHGKDTASPEQLHRMTVMEKAGCICGFVKNADDLQEILDRHPCCRR